MGSQAREYFSLHVLSWAMAATNVAVRGVAYSQPSHPRHRACSNNRLKEQCIVSTGILRRPAPLNGLQPGGQRRSSAPTACSPVVTSVLSWPRKLNQGLPDSLHDLRLGGGGRTHSTSSWRIANWRPKGRRFGFTGTDAAIAADDVAAALADVALAAPLQGTFELAGPEPIRQDDLERQFLQAPGTPGQ